MKWCQYFIGVLRCLLILSAFASRLIVRDIFSFIRMCPLRIKIISVAQHSFSTILNVHLQVLLNMHMMLMRINYSFKFLRRKFLKAIISAAHPKLRYNLLLFFHLRINIQYHSKWNSIAGELGLLITLLLLAKVRCDCC